MTDLPTDPRVHEVAAELAYPRPVNDRHETRARLLLMRADAADAAAGIRRGPADTVERLAKADAAIDEVIVRLAKKQYVAAARHLYLLRLRQSSSATKP